MVLFWWCQAVHPEQEAVVSAALPVNKAGHWRKVWTAAPPRGCCTARAAVGCGNSGPEVPVLWSSTWISTALPARTHLRCSIKNEPNISHLLWSGLALELCNSEFPLKITFKWWKQLDFLFMTNLEKAFIGTAWMECTLRKATELVGLKLKHSDRCGPTDVL